METELWKQSYCAAKRILSYRSHHFRVMSYGNKPSKQPIILSLFLSIQEPQSPPPPLHTHLTPPPSVTHNLPSTPRKKKTDHQHHPLRPLRPQKNKNK